MIKNRHWLMFLWLLMFGWIPMLTAAPIPVLCLASEDTAIQGLKDISPKALAAYRERGYDLHFGTYQKTDRATLFRYPIVVGMMPELYSGTRAIDERLAADLNAYMKAGGGVVMIPAPSYYGVEDFVRQLNPWLEPHGARLLSEIPLDPANQKEIVRILAYRYLRTANLKTGHPVTANIPEIWLPLDFSNFYVVTYSMTLSPDWEVLIRGEKSCATYPYAQISRNNKTVGTWKSEPPFLAVRKVGKGRLALFTTASGYYIYDAFHWSQADGFVLRDGEGNGLKLMDQLFRYVSAGSDGLAASRQASAVKTTAAAPAATGNVPISPDKLKWLDHVLQRELPSGFGVKYYVDCGATSDLAYTPVRGYGYLNVPGSCWLIRWAWSEIFHVTAANCRAADIKCFDYRFDHLDPAKKYRLGVLTWAYQPEGGRELEIRSNGQLLAKVLPPRFDQRQGPRFTLLDIPAGAIVKQSLEINFGRGSGGNGTYTGVGELWLLEQDAAATTPEKILAAYEAPAGGSDEQLFEREYFPGLIGAHSNHTDGKSTVAEMAAAARAAELRFLIFTDDLKQLSPAKLAQLQQDCRKASTADFTAIPGLQLQAAYADSPKRTDDPKTFGSINAYFFGPISQLPPVAELNNPYHLFWKFLGGEYCGGTGVAANLLTPGSNGISPFYQRFWRGFNLLTFNTAGQPLDDSRALYADLLASGYGPHPRVSGEFFSAADITRAATGWKNTVLAPNQNDMPPYQYSSSVTSGPEIRRLAFSSDHMRDGENGGGILFRNRVWLQAHLSVRHRTPITEIILYRGTQPIRHWYPDRRFVKIDEPLLITEQCELSWVIRASDGTEAHSGRFQCQDQTFLAGMCSDNQNSICSVTRPPTAFELDERELYLQHSYWHTGEAAGQIGVMRDARDLVPRVIEAGIIQLCKYFHPTPELHLADGSVENHLNAEMRIKSASRAFNLIRYDFKAPGAALHSRTDITAFRPADDGTTAVWLESTITAQRDLPAASWRKLVALRMGMMPSLPKLWQYTVMTGNGLSSGAFTAIPAGGEVTLPLATPNGGLLLWPNDLANLAVFPLDRNQWQAAMSNVAEAWNVRERFQLGIAARDLKKGETLKTAFLVLLAPLPAAGPETLTALRKQYVDRSGRISRITQGKLESSDYLLQLQADGGAAVFNVNIPVGVDPQPLLVRGMNPQWTCGIWYRDHFAPFSSLEGKMYAVLAPETNGTVAAGHPLLSSDPALVIEWDRLWQGGIRARLHNPTAATLETELYSNPGMTGLPSYRTKIKLAAGESRWIWGVRGVTVEEKPGFLVDKVEKSASGSEIKISNGKKFYCPLDENATITQ